MEADKSINQENDFEHVFVKEENMTDETIKNYDSIYQMKCTTVDLNSSLKNGIVQSSSNDVIQAESLTKFVSVNIKTEAFDSDILDHSYKNTISPESVINAEDTASSSINKDQAKLKKLDEDKCELCKKSFANKAQSQKHKSRCHASIFECEQCKKKFPKKHLLVLHLSDHTGNPDVFLGQQLTNITQEPDTNIADNSARCSTSVPEIVSTSIKTEPSDASVFGSYEDTISEHFDNNSSIKVLSQNKEVASKNKAKDKIKQLGKSIDKNVEHETKIPSTRRTYDCAICKKVLSSGYYLKKHLLELHGKGNFKCFECNKKFCLKKRLQLHIKKKHGNPKLYECKECGIKFVLLKHFTIHNLKCHSKEPFNCDNCSLKFTDDCKFKEHLRTDHPDQFEFVKKNMRKKYECRKCDQEFWDKDSLKDHMRIHNAERPFKCMNCNKSFKQRTSLNEHLRIVHKEYKPYKCDLCDQKFFYEYILKDHMRIHIAETYEKARHSNEHLRNVHKENKSYKCSGCKTLFKTEFLLSRHKLLHTGAINCDTCKKKFMFKCHLKLHFQIQTVERPFKCNICNKSFMHDYGLIKHRLGCEKKNFECDKCGKKFLKPFYLTRHISVHSKEKPYKCNICNKGFKHKDGLKKHGLRKCEKKNLECDKCGKKFLKSFYLTRHISVHSKEKPYKCNICNRGFKQNEGLKKHGLKKCEKRNLECDKCGKKFPKPFYLTRHLPVHSKESSYKCKICKKYFKSIEGRNKHLQKQHSQHKCAECNEQFSSKDDLNEHVKIHRVDEVYNCIQCSENFTDWTSLEVHAKIHIKKEEM